MSIDAAIKAAKAGRRVRFMYNGYLRVAEVHTVGITTAGREAMRAWQVSGQSESGEVPGWKLFCFDEAGPIAQINEKSEAPRWDYKRGDKSMGHILFEL